MTKYLPAIELLRRRFDYDPISGTVMWRVVTTRHGGRTRIGDTVGHRDGRGRMVTRISGRQVYLHRVIWALVTGEWPLMQIDHIDGNPSNNSWSNLRLATNAQNQANQGPGRNNSSGLKGVSLHKSDKWAADIASNGVRYRLGLFATKELAHKAYCEAAHRLHGEFAKVA